MLRPRRTPQEQALYEILTDEIWLGMFLRSYNDFPAEPESRKAPPFKYRWYQKHILTDTSPNIVIRGGRSIGKCQPASARVYTFAHGYCTITQLRRLYGYRTPFLVYTIDDHGQWCVRHAFLAPMPPDYVYTLRLEDGTSLQCTGNHPIATPDGWVFAEDIRTGMYVHTVSHLPWQSPAEPFTPAALAYLGHMLGQPTTAPFSVFVFPSDTVRQDFTRTLHSLDRNAMLHKHAHQTWRIQPNQSVYRTLRTLLQHAGLYRSSYGQPLRQFPPRIKQLSKTSLRTLLIRYFWYIRDGYLLRWNERRIGETSFIEDIRELLLRFGIRTAWHERSLHTCTLRILDEQQFDAFCALDQRYQTPTPDPLQLTRVVDVSCTEQPEPVYALEVADTHTYISEHVYVHNSTVFIDRLSHLFLNAPRTLPQGRDVLFLTPNKSQLVPFFDALRKRFQSPLFRGFVTNVNLSNGTIDFTIKGMTYRLYIRIVGQSSESNVIGLHVVKIFFDEVQRATTDVLEFLRPALNQWDIKAQFFAAGVPNGMQQSILTSLDNDGAWKKYRIPATENPYWTHKDHIRAAQFYGGTNSDGFRRMVLGEHGTTARSVISIKAIKRLPYTFYSIAHSFDRPYRGTFTPALEQKPDIAVLAIDPGFTDPTLIQLFGRYGTQWRTLIRWRLTRIPFPDQAVMIDRIVDAYHVQAVGIDTGAGGGGIGILQHLQHPSHPKSSMYRSIVHGFMFNALASSAGFITQADARVPLKTAAAEELIRMLQDHQLVLSQLDYEGLSQLSRITYQRRPDGSNTYYIVSLSQGKSGDDHIFASFLVFVMTIVNMVHQPKQPKLRTAAWL